MKDAEIRILKAELIRQQLSHERVPRNSLTTVHSPAVIASDITVPGRLHEIAGRTYNSRVGNAPPLEPFVGEGADMFFEEWLPSFERVATWNGWGEAEKLIQLAGHLRGKALQEWSLLNTADTAGYREATSVLKERLDPTRKALAVQDFRHLSQGQQESVADFILHLEQTFRRAYGCNKVCKETCHVLAALS